MKGSLYVRIVANRGQLILAGIDEGESLDLLLSDRAFKVYQKRRARTDRMGVQLIHPKTELPWLWVYEDLTEVVQ